MKVPQTIKAILFDADGVIQRRPRGWRSNLPSLLGFSGDPEQFVAEIWAVETPALDGGCDFRDAFSSLLTKWNCRAGITDALDVWASTQVDEQVADTIRNLRRRGLVCYLATNQEPHRASYMSKTLGYGKLFDKEFYSCHMGVRKPDVAYFHTILNRINRPPNTVLFVDDTQANIDSAREVGLHAARFVVEDGLDALYAIFEQFGIPC